jgi:putative transposase
MLSFKYRVYPTKKQIHLLHHQMQIAKKLYNLLFEKAKEHYQQTGKTFTQFDMNKYITELKKENPEFKELHSQVAQNVSKRLGDSYKAFFRRAKEKKSDKHTSVGFPRFKKWVSSLTYTQSGFKFNSERRLHLSGIGNIPIVLHRVPQGEIKNCIIKIYDSGKWFVGFVNELPETEFKSNEKESIGIDVGLASFATLSDGLKIKPPKFLRKSEEKLKLLHRRVSRKKKGSKNKQKARLDFARGEEKVANQRLDFLHKLSKQLVMSYSVIGLEKLTIQNMTKNHYLAKSINDASWGIFKQMSHYKAWSAGCEVVDVDPRGTTTGCSVCGSSQDMLLSERIYKCHSCGHTEDRDVNSAKVIKARALLTLAKTTVGLTGNHVCGDATSTCLARDKQVVSLKQELNGART